jgi:hypothetical protein
MTYLELFGRPRPANRSDICGCIEAINHYRSLCRPDLAVDYTTRLKEILEAQAMELANGETRA